MLHTRAPLKRRRPAPVRVSLVIGALVGVFYLPGKTKRAVLMAFGASSLIEALAVTELFGLELVFGAF